MNIKAWSCLSACLALSAACGGDDSSGPPDRSYLDASIDGGNAPGIDGGTHDAATDQQALTIRFKAKVGGADLVCGKNYDGQGSTHVTVTPQDFRFYVQSVRLITSQGTEVPLTVEERLPFQSQGVALLDFTTGDGACTSGDPSTNFAITGSIAPGNYTGVAFTVGVPESLNHADPTKAPAPLQAPGVSWGWLQGYRFLMAELRTVRSGDAGMDSGVTMVAADGGVIAPSDGQGLAHIGSTACDGTNSTAITCSNPNRIEVRLTGFDPARSTIVADLGDVFSTADLSTDVQCHGSGAMCTPMFEQLGIDIATGAPLTTQSVYSLE